MWLAPCIRCCHLTVWSIQWRYNKRYWVSNHQRLDCFKRLFRRCSKKTSKPCVTGLCEGNSPVTGEFPTERASNAEMFLFDDVIMVHTGIQSLFTSSIQFHFDGEGSIGLVVKECPHIWPAWYIARADSRFALSQWETKLLCNNASYWLSANLESALYYTLYMLE